MKAFKVIGMALLAIFVSLNFVACSSDDDDDASLAGTTWKVVSVSSSDSDWQDFKGGSATLKSDGSIVFKPTNGWSYAKWSLTDNVLKFTLGEGEPDDCIVGNITFNGNKATWNCYWEDADGDWSDKENPESHAIISLEKQ